MQITRYTDTDGLPTSIDGTTHLVAIDDFHRSTTVDEMRTWLDQLRRAIATEVAGGRRIQIRRVDGGAVMGLFSLPANYRWRIVDADGEVIREQDPQSLYLKASDAIEAARAHYLRTPGGTDWEDVDVEPLEVNRGQ